MAEVDAEARALLAWVLTDPVDPLALQAALAGHPAEEDPHAAKRREVQDALGTLIRLRVLGQIEDADYLTLRAELKT